MLGAATGLVLMSGTSVAARAATPSCDQSWPMYGQDLSHTADAVGCASEPRITPTNASTLVPKWFVSTGDVSATPTVANGMVYVGDAGGTFRAIDQATGAIAWTFSSTANSIHDDQHSPGFGEFASTAAVSRVPGVRDPLVFVGGGGTLFALDAVNGKPLWAQDVDPGQPKSAIEIESSPAVDVSSSPPEVVVGSDDNGSGGIDETGIQAFNAATGALLWKYEPELNLVVHSLTGQDGQGNGCGDVWSSPAIDPSADLVVFGTGNCVDNAAAVAQHDFSTNAGIFAVNLATGERVWSFFEPPNQYDTGQVSDAGSGDDDFGSSAILTRTGGRKVVLEGSKSGYVYALDEATGAKIWQDEPAQAGQLSPQLVGSIGGFIGSAALGQVYGQPALFLSSAVPLPFSGEGLNLSGTGTLASLDPSLLTDPTRVMSLHAVSVASGQVLWQDPISTPTYAAATYSDGVVFLPASTGLAVAAYDANTGLPLWAFPLGAVPASGVSIVGTSIFLGTGLSEGSVGSVGIPPEVSGVWSFGTA